MPVNTDDINLELKLRRCLIGINSDEGSFLSAAFASSGSSLEGGRLSSSSLKKKLRQSGEGSSALLSALLWLSSEADEAKVRTHYGLEVESWSNLTRAISDALFVYPFYRMLNTLTKATSDEEATKVFAYKFSHRGDASLTQIITNGLGDASSKAVSHFDEVLIQFENKVILALLMMGGPRSLARVDQEWEKPKSFQGSSFPRVFSNRSPL